MVILALLALIGGILCGLSGFQHPILLLLTQHSDIILYCLMFFVGISVGMHKGLFSNLSNHKKKIILLPLGTILGSVAGGILCSFLSGIPVADGCAISCGLGWYSLSGVSITALSGAELGSIAFLSNLMREIFSFFCIPWISRHLNASCCIAISGATSEDTTLPMMIRYTTEEHVVISVMHGIICSAFVPILISLSYQLFG